MRESKHKRHPNHHIEDLTIQQNRLRILPNQPFSCLHQNLDRGPTPSSGGVDRTTTPSYRSLVPSRCGRTNRRPIWANRSESSTGPLRRGHPASIARSRRSACDPRQPGGHLWREIDIYVYDNIYYYVNLYDIPQQLSDMMSTCSMCTLRSQTGL